MNKQFERYLQITLVVLDLLVPSIMYVILLAFFENDIPQVYLNTYISYLALANITWLLLSFILRNYTTKIILSFENFTKRTIQVYIIWIVFIMFYLFFSRELSISRLFISLTMIAFGSGLIINRFLYLGIKHYFRYRNFFTKKYSSWVIMILQKNWQNILKKMR